MRGRIGAFLHGAGESALVIAAFVVVGLGAAELAARASGRGGAYAPPRMEPMEPRPAPVLWLVDGFNVLHAGMLGSERSEWWTAPRRGAVLERASRFDDRGAEIWVVFDGPRPAPESARSPDARLREVYAPSADEWLLARVSSLPDPSRAAVVTADRKVAARARHRGARIVSPREFLARCPG